MPSLRNTDFTVKSSPVDTPSLRNTDFTGISSPVDTPSLRNTDFTVKSSPVDRPSLRNTGFSNLTTGQSKIFIKLLLSQGNGPEFQNQGSFNAFTLRGPELVLGGLKKTFLPLK
jgi:hypothetical protein